jgi:DNA transposition AAA+ family ATPase
MASSGGVVIIDEAQQLNFGALDLLRQIQEQAGVGMVWSGNEPLYTQMTGGARGPKFAQIFSRIAQRTHIELTQADDVDLVAGAMGVTDKASVDYLRQIGVLPGGLRGVVKTLQLASMAAAGSGKALDRDLIARAWRKLTNE